MSNQIHEDRRRPTRASHALFWWALALLWFVRTVVFFRRREAGEFAAIDFYAVLQIALVFFTAACLCLAFRLPSVWRRLGRTAARWFLLGYILGVVSALWSPMPLYSGYRAVEALIEAMAVFMALSYEKRFYQAERRVLWVFVICFVLDLLKYVRAYGGIPLSMHLWHTNVYTAFCAMAFCYCIGEILAGRRKGRARLRGFAIVALVGLLLGTSAGSNVAVLCGLVVAALLAHNRKLVAAGIIAGLIILVLGIGESEIVRTITAGKTMEQISGFSGRMRLWRIYWEIFKQNPIIGEGFAVSARLARIYTTQTHNAAFSILLGTGVVGLSVFGLFVMRLIRDALWIFRRRTPGAIGCMAALTAGLANSMTAAFLGEAWRGPTLIFAAFLALYCFFVAERLSDSKRLRISTLSRSEDSLEARSVPSTEGER